MCNILLVEDNEANRILVHAMLKNDYPIFDAATLKDARQRLSERLYRLVLLDLTLPDGSGLELVEDVKRHTVPPPSVVAVSASTVESVKAAARLAGVDVFVEKPIRPQAFQALVRSLVARAGGPTQVHE